MVMPQSWAGLRVGQEKPPTYREEDYAFGAPPHLLALYFSLVKAVQEFPGERQCGRASDPGSRLTDRQAIDESHLNTHRLDFSSKPTSPPRAVLSFCCIGSVLSSLTPPLCR